MYILNSNEVLKGYDKVVSLYPFVPSLSLWRAWECAAYKKFQLSGRVLDLGCGDGQYFKLLWPECKDVVGVEIEQRVAELGMLNGVYGNIHISPAHLIPEKSASFDNIFANCSLEHMDHLDKVLAEVFRCLKPGGTLLCSVVTNYFIEWSVLPAMIAQIGHQNAAKNLQKQFLKAHHLVNPLTIDDWRIHFSRNGLEVVQYIPLLPKFTSGLFLLIDSIWHVNKEGGGELGDLIFPFLSINDKFPLGFRKVLEGVLEMEIDQSTSSGAVFLVRKPFNG